MKVLKVLNGLELCLDDLKAQVLISTGEEKPENQADEQNEEQRSKVLVHLESPACL